MFRDIFREIFCRDMFRDKFLVSYFSWHMFYQIFFVTHVLSNIFRDIVYMTVNLKSVLHFMRRYYERPQFTLQDFVLKVSEAEQLPLQKVQQVGTV